MKRKIIFNIASLVGILLFIGVSLSFTSIERTHIVYSNLKVVFNERYRYVTEKEIENIVYKNFKGLKGALIDTVNTEQIESKIEEHPWVKKAEVFKGYANSDKSFLNGGIIILIEQEDPVLRFVKGADGYFVNKHGKHLPFSNSNTKNVPVITGSIDDNFLQNDLIPFLSEVTTDAFWKALIEQIHVTKNKELIIVPRVGDHKIEFGPIVNVDKKFRNLKAVYKDGFKNDGWNKYKIVSVKYQNQVVCTLR